MSRVMHHEFKARGHYWRCQSDDRGRFDELVVVIGKAATPKNKNGSGLVLHAEMMDDRSCFIDVAGVALWVHVDRDGIARITMSEDRRKGGSHKDLRDPALDRPKMANRRFA